MTIARNRKSTALKPWPLLIAAALTLPSRALATDVASAYTEAQTTLQEVTVTAQRRNQSAQSIGITVTPISGEQINDLQLIKPANLAELAPGLQTTNSTSDGTPIFAIRGVGLDDFNPNNSSGVAVSSDGVFQSSPILLNGQMFDITRVEVLKGPQGTLYGANATGGAINIISNTPSEKTNGYVNFDYGSWDMVDVNAALGGRISDTLAGRVAVSSRIAGEGWQTDRDTGRHYGKPDLFGIRSLLDFHPTDSFSTLLNIHFSNDASIPVSPQAYGNEALLPPAAAGRIDTGTSDPSIVRVGDFPIKLDNRGLGANLTLEYDTAIAKLTSIAAWDEFSIHTVDNYDGIPGPSGDFYQRDRLRQLYWETHLASSQKILNGTTNWLLGLTLLDSKVDGHDSYDASSVFVGQYENPPNFTTTGLAVAQADLEQIWKSGGLYAHTETALTSRLTLTLGVRYSRDSVSFDGVGTEVGSDDGGILFQGVGSVVQALDETHDQGNTSFHTGLSLQATEHILFYANFGSGYKAGVYYAFPPLAKGAWQYTKPESIVQTEVGTKTQWLKSRLQVNVAAFYSDYHDRQSQLLFQTPNALVTSLANIPKSEIYGGELELNAEPLPGWSIGGGISLLHAVVIQGPSSVDGYPLYAPVAPGTPLSQAPKVSGSLRTSYQHSISARYWARGELNYFGSSRQWAFLADPHAYYGPGSQLGARFTVGPQLGPWEVYVWSHNLTNTNYITYETSSFYGGYGSVYRVQPRSYGLGFDYRFE